MFNSPKLLLRPRINTLPFKPEILQLNGQQELHHFAPRSCHTWGAMKKMRVNISMDHWSLHAMTNTFLKAQASNRLISSNMEPDTLTVKQINAEVGEQT